MRLRQTVFGIVLMLVFCVCAMAQDASFTIEQVMSSPFPSGLVASPKGDKVAWIFNAQGKRNVWIAESPNFEGRSVTNYVKDDGQPLSNLVFSPNGELIAYVRGEGRSWIGSVPNPSSDIAGAKQEIFIVNTKTNAITNIGEGNNPFFTKDGANFCYSQGGKLWSVSVNGGQAKKMFEVRGGVSSASWSPDGSKLVFVTNRGEQSYISVYDPRVSSLRYLQASVDRDQEPRWSSDGKRVAFIRGFNVSNTYSIDADSLSPWSIWVVDVETGAGKEVWRSGNTHNDSYISTLADEISFPTFGGSEALTWIANNRLAFCSEKDGWAHLYSISADGGDEKLLTPGAFEVENIAYSPDKTFAVIAANKNDINRRHIWRVDLISGQMQAITKDAGIEMRPVIVNDGKQIAFFHSTARDPFMPYVADVDGANMKPLAASALPKDFPTASLVEPEGVTFKAADGLEIHGQLFKPKNVSGKRPAVIYMHGGPIRQMLLGFHYSNYYHNAYAMNQYLAGRGYVVLSVNYRSGIGYGREFREAKHRGPRGESEYQDIVAAGKYLQSRADVDAKKIGLWGGSYGGYLTAMGLARNSDMFAAGVDLHGVHNWTTQVGGESWAKSSEEIIKLGYASSPISTIDKWKSPVLLVQGDDDRNVTVQQTIDLVKLLREKNIPFELLIIPDDVHDFLRYENWVRVYKASADFFDRKLK